MRVKILYTGGTFGMQMGPTGLQPAGELTERIGNALDLSPEYKSALEGIEWSVHENTPLLDSANIMPANWEQIAEQCSQHQDVEGIVIIHGTDTLAYTASALAFFLQSTELPIVVTGSQKPLGASESDAMPNLVGAMYELLNAKPGIWVYFHQQFMPGARVVKKDAISDLGFAAPRLRPGQLSSKTPLHINWQPTRRHWASVKVGIAHMVPGYDVSYLLALLDSRPNAVILSLYGLGTLADKNRALLSAIDSARQKSIALAAISQCYVGHIDFSVYATGNHLDRLGVLNGRDMTLEAAYAKLMVLFRMGYSHIQVMRLFEQNLANEMSSGDE